jgi:hypothetical protein
MIRISLENSTLTAFSDTNSATCACSAPATPASAEEMTNAVRRRASTGVPRACILDSFSGMTTASSYVLHDATVTGFSNTNGVETVAFGFRSVEVTAGGVTCCFDLSTNASR